MIRKLVTNYRLGILVDIMIVMTGFMNSYQDVYYMTLIAVYLYECEKFPKQSDKRWIEGKSKIKSS